MSKSKYDLIVRTRYQNPIPAPKFGPKLINLEPSLERLSEYDFSAPLVAEQPHPMIVDAESGMPLQLQQFAELWDDEDEEDQLELNPKEEVELDDEDLDLLVDPSQISNQRSANTSGASTPIDRTSNSSNTAWLYKSKYSNNTDLNEKRITHNRAALNRLKSQEVKVFDDSPEGRAQEIESTFRFEPTSVHQLDDKELSEIKHPQKKHLKAVDTYDFLPDFETFANDYFIMRFADDPSDRNTSSDPRLHNGILRPRYNEQGETWLQYYLPENDEQYTLLRSKLESDSLPENIEEQERVIYNYIREYNITNEQKDMTDLLLMFDDGLSKQPGSSIVNSSLASARPRGKGVYYKNMPTRMTLKKRRPKDEEDEEKWDKIQLGLEPLNEEEVNDRISVEDYFMPGGAQRAVAKKEEEKRIEEAEKEEEKLRIKAEKIQQKQEVERERKAAMEEQARKEEEEKGSAALKEKSDESDDEDFADKQDKDEDKSDAGSDDMNKEVERDGSGSPESDNENDKFNNEAVSKEIDEAISREVDQRQGSNPTREVDNGDNESDVQKDANVDDSQDVEMKAATPPIEESPKDVTSTENVETSKENGDSQMEDVQESDKQAAQENPVPAISDESVQKAGSPKDTLKEATAGISESGDKPSAHDSQPEQQGNA
ncbi:hypothetical protein E3Q11_00338 [Wallemia mellicola]|nr:hypothetical protein E3Q11_00338 [Wallemia mellicola]